MTSTTSTTAEQADRRAWIGLAVLAAPCMLVTMDLTVLFLALPKLVADLDPSATQQLWITDIYGFLIAGALILMGSIGDRVGRRKVLMIGGAAFGAASLLAAFSQSPEQLIAARAIQGLAGATLVPSTMSLVFAMFPDERKRTAALGVIMSCFVGGAAAGPLIGGALLEAFEWNSVFLINVPVAVALLVLAPRFLPEFKNPEAGRVDFASAVLLVAAILPTIYGIKQAATHGADATSLLATGTGVLFGIAFAARQRRLAEPLLDVSLFRTRAFSAALGGNVLGAFVMYGIFFFTSQYFQLVLGMSPLVAGLWMLPMMVTGIVGTLGAPWIVRHLRAGTAMTLGFAVAVPGLALMTLTGRLPVVIGLAVVSMGIQVVLALTYDVVVSSAPPERAGVASGMGETGSELGIALGIAIGGSLVTAVYRAGVPVGTPDTLGGAVAAAEQQSGQAARELLELARDAYTNGVQLAVVMGAVVVILLGVATATLVRPN
jgi:MFS transporter, DHA2 family, multidrug resistance protein